MPTWSDEPIERFPAIVPFVVTLRPPSSALAAMRPDVSTPGILITESVFDPLFTTYAYDPEITMSFGLVPTPIAVMISGDVELDTSTIDTVAPLLFATKRYRPWTARFHGWSKAAPVVEAAYAPAGFETSMIESVLSVLFATYAYRPSRTMPTGYAPTDAFCVTTGFVELDTSTIDIVAFPLFATYAYLPFTAT
jgi:hypothetical protein